MASVDLTVRGAGIFGLSIAWTAAKRGAAVQVIDPNGVGFGSSGGVVGALAPHVPENWNAKKAFQLKSLLLAPSFWTEVQAAGGDDPGYARTGRLQPISDPAALALAQQRHDSAKDHWGTAARWDVVSASDATWEPHSASGYLIRDTLSAVLHPRKACAALASALKAKGVPILPDGPDQGAVLWATGVAGLREMSQAHTRSIGAGVKGQAALFQHDAAGLPQLYTEGLHIVPHQDRTTAVGSTSERDYMDPQSTDDQLDEIIAQARRAVGVLDQAPVIARWAGERPRSRSRAPMIGPWPGRPGHFVANGGFKIGFGMAPNVATTMVDLILEQTDTIPDGFRVEDNL